MTSPLPSSSRDSALRLEPRDPRPPRRVRPPAGNGEPVLDFEWLTDLLRFPFGALARHRALAFVAAGSVFGAALLAAIFMPRTYEVESRILTRRSMVLPALGNPRRTVPTESDAPARLAVEAVMSRENLAGIIDSTGLRAIIPQLVTPPRRAYESLRELVKEPRTPAEQRDMLIKLLEKKMIVAADDDKEGTVAIGIRWRHPASALAIVEAAQSSFLGKRYEQEVELLNESIGILERYVGTANESIARSMSNLRGLPGVRVSETDAQRLTASSQSTARTRAINSEMARAQAQLTSVRGALSQQEAAFTQRVSTAQARLTELESQYGTAHPEVAAARKALESAMQQPTSLRALRSEEQVLVDQLAQLGAAVPGSTEAGAELAMQRLNFERLMRERADSLEDPRLTYGRSQLKIAITNYEDMLERLEAARIELETARAAFKHRYTVTSPPELPKRPVSPNVLLLLVGGLVLAALAALFAVTARDVLGGRVVERWQIKRQLGLPLLGEVRRG
jgi:hypothetical protein